VDMGSIVVHIMQPSIRQYYNLEELWAPPPRSRRKRAAAAR
jgi:ribosome-associated protein